MIFVGPDALIGPLGGSFHRENFAACGRRVTLPTAARRRKVHSTPFPPGGENCVRSLAPPLPGEPASLGFAGSNEGLGKTPPGTAPDEHFVLIVAYPTPSGPSGHLPLTGGVGPGPHYGGYPLSQAGNFRRAKSEWRSKFPPGHWALAVQKLPLLRFHNRAWPCRAGGGWCWVVGRGLLDAPCTSAGRPVSGPYVKNRRFLDTP